MNRVPNQIIEEIRSRCDIVELIGSYLPLKQRGSSYYAVCPFHTEKTPSFAVNPAKQIFHCFGCGVGGDVFSFVAKHQNLSFYEAIKVLADRCGVRLSREQQTSQELDRLKEREQLFTINTLAADYYQQLLKKQAGAGAREYLARREVSNQCIEKFGLGYAPSGWNHLLKYMANQGVATQKLLQVGLIIPRSKGAGFYDRFRQRLMFPIYNAQGKLIGFGGRALDDEQQPKYLNSPDTPLYHKGEGFYGLNWAREGIGKNGLAIIVEGYLDLITAHQYGFTKVVATLGTAITQAQVRQLRQWAKEVVIFFDSDQAGISAAARSWTLFLDSGLRVRVATLKAESDPDSYLRDNGAAAFRECIGRAVNLLDFVIEQSVIQSKLDSIEGKIEALNKVLPVLASINNRVERTSYLKQLAERLHIEEGVLLQELRKVVESGRRKIDKQVALSADTIGSATQLAEKMLIQLMICYPSTQQSALSELKAHDFTSAVYAAIFKAIEADEHDVEEVDITALMSKLHDEPAKAFVGSVAMEHEHFENAQRVATDCIQVIQRRRLKTKLNELKELRRKTKSTTDTKPLQECDQLMKEMKMGNSPTTV